MWKCFPKMNDFVLNVLSRIFLIYRHPGALRRKPPAVVHWRSLSRIRMPKKDKVRNYFSDPLPGFGSSSILYFSVSWQYYITLRFVPKKISKWMFLSQLTAQYNTLYRDTQLETLFNIKYKTNKKYLIDKRSFLHHLTSTEDYFRLS